MKIVVELLKMGQDRTLDSGQVHRMVYAYMNERSSSGKCSWRTDAGAEARLFANALEAKLKPVINALANIDSGLYYPSRVEGRIIKTDKGGKIEYLTIKSRDEMYTYLINKLDEGEDDGKK